ncbi:MAG: RagB/SusD family nutrient uptake outer membrane protein [Chitinophagaceae bacterium]
MFLSNKSQTINWRRLPFFLIFILGSLSCNKNILEYTDPDSYNTDNYFNSPEQIRQAANAIYVGFYFNSMMGFEWPELYDVLAFEAEPTPNALVYEKDICAIRRYQYVNTNPVIENYWRMLYRMILRANLVLDKGGQYFDKGGSDPNLMVTNSMGEAYFLRGWCYFQLAFNWGRVPLRTSFNQAGNEDAPRAGSVDQVWAIAETDFKKAAAMLPETWAPDQTGRASRGAAIGFLGKLYLYNKRYDEAEKKFAELPSKYRLLDSSRWLDNFGETNKNNEESLFEVQFQWYEGNFKGNFSAPEGNDNMPVTQTTHQQLYGWNDWTNWGFVPNREKDFIYAVNGNVAYQDPRAKLTFYGGIGASTWLGNSPGGPKVYAFTTLGYWYKKILNKENKETESNQQSSNNLRLLRYADVILMRAECKMQQGNLVEAINLINQVRKRVGAVPYSVQASKADVFKLLMRERQLEFMGEQMRFNDLKRWNILRETLNPECESLFGTPNILDKHNLFPIPNIEISTNLGLGPVKDEWN